MAASPPVVHLMLPWKRWEKLEILLCFASPMVYVQLVVQGSSLCHHPQQHPVCFLFSCICCDLTDWDERFYGTQRKSQIWKRGLEEKAFLPLTVNRSLRMAIYANKQGIRRAIHLEVLWERGPIKLPSVILPHPSTSTTTKWLANWNVSFCCFAYLGPFKSTMKIFFMIRPTHEMVKSTLTFTKCYNQWCNLRK